MTCARMLKTSAKTIERICQHSYNQELQSKSLPRQVFKAYLEQDALYLKAMSKALRIIAPKLSDSNHKQFISTVMDETVHYEKTMLGTYLGTQQTLFNAVAMNDVVRNYTNHLFTCASQSSAIAMASILPCFWIYSELGRQIPAEVVKDVTHPYNAWIKSYACEEFFTTAEKLKCITESLSINSDEQDAMITAFATSANFELDFYEHTYPHKEPSVQNALTLRHGTL